MRYSPNPVLFTRDLIHGWLSQPSGDRQWVVACIDRAGTVCSVASGSPLPEIYQSAYRRGDLKLCPE